MNTKLTREEAHLCLMALDIAQLAYSDEFEEKIREYYKSLDLQSLLQKLSVIMEDVENE